MKYKIYFAITLTLFFFCSTFTEAKNNIKLSAKVKEMIEYANHNKSHQAMNLYKNFSQSQKKEFIKYLEQNPGSFSPIYLIMVADEIYEKDKDNAVFMYNFGKTRALEDVRMCKDSSARQQLMFYSLIAPKTVKYMQSKATDYNYISDIYNKIIEWDNKYSDRVSPVWACYHGIQAFSGEPELLPDTEFKKIQTETHEELKKAAKIITEMASKKESTQ